MKQTIGFYEFSEAFRNIRPDNFSYEGLQALFEYLEQYEDETGEEIELDVIAICCDFSELTLEEYCNEYDLDYDELDIDEIIEHAEDNTIVIRVDENTIIIQDY